MWRDAASRHPKRWQLPAGTLTAEHRSGPSSYLHAEAVNGHIKWHKFIITPIIHRQRRIERVRADQVKVRVTCVCEAFRPTVSCRNLLCAFATMGLLWVLAKAVKPYIELERHPVESCSGDDQIEADQPLNKEEEEEK
ncbi:hypothetical protein DUI87_02314 [Hirundo rustica rustica]|uniref:Uncharacterized protein n=1 Tax=Hirundo rustica rustica TaxID=333673 RepID=A0A3M0L7U4_HIRRU|nr:hypothetical protein DUI87_02314 [Hirundo rustica rustica]